MVIALTGVVDDGNAEYGVGSVEYGDQTPVSSLSCHIPGGPDKGGSTWRSGAGCPCRLGNGDLLHVVADPDFGLTAERSVGNCCPDWSVTVVVVVVVVVAVVVVDDVVGGDADGGDAGGWGERVGGAGRGVTGDGLEVSAVGVEGTWGNG